jgi:glycosyltransferase involved in cell wall biosynthesis
VPGRKAPDGDGKLDTCVCSSGLRKTHNCVSCENVRVKLSVVMITYNHGRFIAHAIESVLAQRVNFDCEIVIGDDCSTDDTRAIIMDYHRRYPGRILPLLRDQNIGGPRNMEATLAACRGQYLALIEGDDYWTCHDKLQRQVDFLDAHHDCAICCHRVQILDEMNTGQAGVFPSRGAGSYTIEDLLKENFVFTCTTVVRRDLFGPLPECFLEMNIGDWPRVALVARRGRIELMDEAMAVYRSHSGGIWSSLPLTSQLMEIAEMLTVLDKHLDFQYTDTIRQTIARPYLELAMASRRRGSRTETVKHLISYVRNGGFQLPGSRRPLASLAAYALLGSWYKMFTRSKSLSGS